mmetsp:Transcript_34055/g.82476  ORF Transcript_34055/g.82476 Transcript_34055/m.82476 type:complete len:127 (+) Transcript_34055:92-472(+)
MLSPALTRMACCSVRNYYLASLSLTRMLSIEVVQELLKFVPSIHELVMQSWKQFPGFLLRTYPTVIDDGKLEVVDGKPFVLLLSCKSVSKVKNERYEDHYRLNPNMFSGKSRGSLTRGLPARRFLT